MEVQDDGAGSTVSPEASLVGLQMAVIFPCLHGAFSLSMYIPGKDIPHKDSSHIGLWSHPYNLI